MFSWHSFSIRTKLLVSYALVLSIVLSFGGMYAYRYFSHSIRTSIESNLNNTVDSIKHSVHLSASVSVKNYMRSLAESSLSTVTAYYKQAAEGKISMEKAQSLSSQALLQHKVGKSGYIYCLNSNGTVSMHPFEEVVGLELGHIPFIKKQMALRTGYIEYQWRNPNDTKPRDKALYMSYFEPWDWIISVSVYRDELADLVNVSDFNAEVIPFKIGESGYAFVMDDTGDMLIGPDAPGCAPHLIGKSNSCYLFFEEMLTEKNGQINYRWKAPEDAGFEDRIIIYRNLPEYDWIIGISGYVNELYADLHSFQRWFICSLFVIFALVLVTTWFVAGKLVTPLKTLAECLQSCTTGNFSNQVEVKGDDEIGRLGTYFNVLTENMKQHKEELENLVNERTQEMARINSEYLKELKEKSEVQSTISRQVAFLDTLINTIPSPIFYRDTQGYFLGCNDSFASNILGVNSSDVKGKTVREFPEAYSHELRRDIVNIDAQLATTMQPVSAEIKMRCADGKVRHYVVNKAAFADDSGKMAGIIGVMTDITKRNQAEEARLLLERAIERAPSAIYITDASGHIQYANPAFSKLSGYSLSESLYHKPSMLKSHLEDEQIFDEMWQTINKGEVWSGLLTNKRKDGSFYETDSTVSPVLDDNGNIAWFVCVQRDISDRVRIESTQIQTQKLEALGQLAAGMAKELGEPAKTIQEETLTVEALFTVFQTVINNAASLATSIQQGHSTPASEAAREFLNELNLADFNTDKVAMTQSIKNAKVSADQIALIVSAMNEFAVMQQDPTATTDINNCIQTILTISRGQWQPVASIQTNLDDNLPVIQGTSAEMYQVLLNILLNAIQAIEEVQDPDHNGAISISSSFSGSEIQISITDNGVGIANDILPQIFTPFFTTKRASHSKGQGLSIAKAHVNNVFNGTIDAKSSLGNGTTLTITIPA